MSDERSTDYAVANLKLAIRYIGDNDRPAIRALDLATALDLVESQAVDLSRLREERDALTHDRDQARDEADNWRQQAWMEGYPRDSGDRHPWETSDEYRDLLAAGWASPTPRISPEATS